MFDFENEALDAEINGAPQKAEDPEIDALMSEAEKRFAKAQYYKALLTEPLFSDDFSPTAETVVAEIRTFVRGRLAVLLGVTQEAAPAKKQEVFTDEEVKALKAVASRVNKKPELASSTPPSVAPIAETKKPTLKQAKSPQPKQKESAPEPKKKVKEGFTGQTLTIDGLEYREKADARGNHWVTEDGRMFLVQTNASGKNYMKNITPKAVSPGRLPQPSFHQMMALASQSVDTVTKNDKIVGTVIGTTLTQGE